MPPKKTRKTRPKQAGVRIIGGQWRGRRLSVPEADSLRPTHDRIRETLFNWLAPSIAGSTCLDLYAGSGILAFEALSRGAKHAWLIEKNPQVIRHLQAQAQSLAPEQATVLNQHSLTFLQSNKVASFDLVFIDPPYTSDLLEPSCKWLEAKQWLNPGAYIYLEFNSPCPPTLPKSWEILKQKQTATLHYWLAQQS